MCPDTSPCELLPSTRDQADNNAWGADAAADAKHTAADTTATALTNSGTCADANAAAGTRTNTTARTGSVRRRSGRQMRHRITQIRQVVGSHLDLRRNHDRRLSRQLGIIVAHHHHRRRDLLHRLLGQFALGRLELVAIAATTAAARPASWPVPAEEYRQAKSE